MAELDTETKMIEKTVTVEETTFVLRMTKDEASALLALVEACPCGENDRYYRLYQALSGSELESVADTPAGRRIDVNFVPSRGAW